MPALLPAEGMSLPLGDSGKAPATVVGLRTGYQTGASHIDFKPPCAAEKPAALDGSTVGKLLRVRQINDEERVALLYSPKRAPRFRHSTAEDGALVSPFALDTDSLPKGPVRRLTKHVPKPPSSTGSPRCSAKRVAHHPDSMVGPLDINGTPSRMRGRVHPQHDAEGVRKRAAPYWHSTSSYRPIRSTMKLFPSPEDHLQCLDPLTNLKITDCARRSAVSQDHVTDIFKELPSSSDYRPVVPPANWVLRTPYGTDLAYDPPLGPGVRCVPFMVGVACVPAASPGRLQRSKGMMSPPHRPNPMLWDLD